MNDDRPAQSRLRQIRLLLWSLIAVALVAIAGVYLVVSARSHVPEASKAPARSAFGGPFTLVAADGKPFSSEALAGKPYAIYFGFTRCADTCPTTLSRLVKLRREAGGDRAIQILFVTIDPDHDGPKEVGQYASLFNAPITGLTGSREQIEQVKKQYGIFAQPVADAPMGKEMEHTANVLLFDRTGQFAGSISSEDPDSAALSKMRALLG